IVGQAQLLEPGKPLRTAIERDQVPSMILWGPPGVGKTTLAQIIARITKSTFVAFSAVLASIKEIKEIMSSAEKARRMGRQTIEEASQKTFLYDKSGEEHYNIISALHKSLRNSDADAALYWLARMLEAGEDPLYIVRRLVRFASEDIGLADPRALRIALDAKDAFNFIGLPEGKLALAQCVIYLAAAPKSNAVY